MQQERVIRKYTNRRLYDTAGSRHVTLEDLRQLIVAGEKIKVIDDKSGEDLTRPVLLQIISEQEHLGSPVLSAELLEMIIRFYGRPMQALLSGYMEQAFTAMLRQQETMQSEMAKAMQGPFAPLTELAQKNLALWEQMQAATRDAFIGRGDRIKVLQPKQEMSAVHIADGYYRASGKPLAVFTENRVADLPDVPTIAEAVRPAFARWSCCWPSWSRPARSCPPRRPRPRRRSAR